MFRKTGGRVSSAPKAKHLTPTGLERILEGLGFKEIKDKKLLMELKKKYITSIERARYSCQPNDMGIRAMPVSCLAFRLMAYGKSWEEAHGVMRDFWGTKLMRGESFFLTLPEHVYVEVNDGNASYSVYMGNARALKGPLVPWEEVEKRILERLME